MFNFIIIIKLLPNQRLGLWLCIVWSLWLCIVNPTIGWCLKDWVQINIYFRFHFLMHTRGRRGRDCMVVGFTTTPTPDVY